VSIWYLMVEETTVFLRVIGNTNGLKNIETFGGCFFVVMLQPNMTPKRGYCGHVPAQTIANKPDPAILAVFHSFYLQTRRTAIRGSAYSKIFCLRLVVGKILKTGEGKSKKIRFNRLFLNLNRSHINPFECFTATPGMQV